MTINTNPIAVDDAVAHEPINEDAPRFRCLLVAGDKMAQLDHMKDREIQVVVRKECATVVISEFRGRCLEMRRRESRHWRHISQWKSEPSFLPCGTARVRKEAGLELPRVQNIAPQGARVRVLCFLDGDVPRMATSNSSHSGHRRVTLLAFPIWQNLVPPDAYPTLLSHWDRSC